MDPQGFMRVQILALIVVYGLLAFLREPVALAVFVGALLLAALSLVASYFHALGKRERHPERAECDTEVLVQIALGIVVPLLCFAARALVGIDPVTGSLKVELGLIAAAAFWLTVYVSSLVDWFYIRSRRDGVLVEPPCRTSGSRKWRGVTRVWWANRCLAIFACYVTTILFVVAMGLELLGETTDSDGAIAGLVVSAVGAATVSLRLFYGGLSAVGEAFASCFFSPPEHSIGQVLAGPPGFVGGFLREIAIEGLTLVRLDADEMPVMSDKTTASTKRHSLKTVLGETGIATERYGGCKDSCSGVNDYCMWLDPNAGGEPEDEAEMVTPAP